MVGELMAPGFIPEDFGSEFKLDFNYNNLKELHDKVSRFYTIVKAQKLKKPIVYTEEAKKLELLSNETYRFELAKSTVDLAAWGSELSHCIASYGDKAVEGRSILFAVFKNDKLTYCGEFLANKGIPQSYLQMRGLRNKDAEVEDKAWIFKAFNDWTVAVVGQELVGKHHFPPS
jgi:hypothetical protein